MFIGNPEKEAERRPQSWSRGSRTRILAATFGVLAVAWPFLGYVTGHFSDVPQLDQGVLVTVTLVVLIFTPVVMLPYRLASLGAALAGLVNLSSSVLTFYAAMEVDFGRGVLAIFAIAFVYFSIQSYRQMGGLVSK